MRHGEIHFTAGVTRRRLDGRNGRRQEGREDAEVEVGYDGVREVPGGREGGLEDADPAGGNARNLDGRGPPGGEKRKRGRG
jgi:hypothetical protein